MGVAIKVVRPKPDQPEWPCSQTDNKLQVALVTQTQIALVALVMQTQVALQPPAPVLNKKGVVMYLLQTYMHW